MSNLKRIITAIGLKEFSVILLNSIRQLKAHGKWIEIQRDGRIWLELGSGPKKGSNGWTTVDLVGADIAYDLRKGIPLPNNSVDRIYTSHMLEHIPYKSLVLFLNECFRVLKIGGELSVCVPNAGYFIAAYIAKKEFISKADRYAPANVDTCSLIDQLNYIAYMDGQHNYMFDEENLINTIKKAPFSSVKSRSFDPAIDLEERHIESIYASALK